jgi:hypothetical protein
MRQLAAEMLPSWAAACPKLHQTIPIGEWFRGPLRDLLEDHLANPLLRDIFDMNAVEVLKQEHLIGRVDHAWRLWALVSFVAWHDHVLKPSTATTAETLQPEAGLVVSQPEEIRKEMDHHA